jgi:hypothetical protein
MTDSSKAGTAVPASGKFTWVRRYAGEWPQPEAPSEAFRDIARGIIMNASVPETASVTPLPPAKMEYRETVRFINEDCTWAPGWKVTAEYSPSGWYGSNNITSAVSVHMSKESKNSSAPAADGSYPEYWQLNWSLAVPSHAFRDKDALVYWILEKMVWCEEHEHREFARYKKEDGSWYAPLHPHRGYHYDQHITPEWQAQYRDPADQLIAARRPGDRRAPG